MQRSPIVVLELALLVFLMPLLAHPSPARATAAAADVTGEVDAIHGIVRRADGTGAGGVTVELRPLPSNFDAFVSVLEGRLPVPAAVVETDAEGRFHLLARHAGVWQIRLAAPGFVAMRYPLLPAAGDVELPPVVLRRAVAVEARVRDGAGRPRSGVEIYGESADGGFWRRWTEGGWRPELRLARTDEQGRARLWAARGERLELRARPSGRLDAAVVEGANYAAIVLEPSAAVAVRLSLRDEKGAVMAGAVAVDLASGLPLGRANRDGVLLLRGELAEPRQLLLLTAGGREHRHRLELPAEGGPYAATVVFEPPIRIAGRTLDPTGRPLAGALVWPGHDPARFVRSDGAGGWRLAAAAGTRSRVQAHARDRLPQARAFEAMRDAPATDLVLEPAARLAGRVTDDDGRPLAGVELRVDAESPEARPLAIRFDRADGRAVSDGAGRFELAGLPPATPLALHAAKTGFAGARLDLAALDPGARPEAVELALIRGRLIFGRVRDADQRPVAGAEVRLRASGKAVAYALAEEDSAGAPPATPTSGDKPDEAFTATDGEAFTATTDDAGRFELRRLPGSRLDVLARAPGFAPITVRGLRVPEGDGPVDLGTLILLPGAVVRGRVIDAAGEAIAGAGVWRAPGVRDARRWLDRERRYHERHGDEPDAVADADGIFVLADLEPGRGAHLVIDAPGFLPGLALGLEAPVEEPIEMILARAAGVAGRVVDGEGVPVPGAEIAVELLEREVETGFGAGVAASHAARSRTAHSGDAGEFVLADLPPGRLAVSAYAEEYQPTPALELELEPGEERDLRLVLEPGAVLEGRVGDADGEPIAGARITVGRSSARSDARGRYRLAGVPPGPALAEVRHPGYDPLVRELDLGPGVEHADFTLAGGHRIAGFTVDRHGLPVAGALVELRPAEGGGARSYTARADGDGAFTVERAANGRYHAVARKPGWVPLAPLEVEVAGGPLDDLEVPMQAGARVVGRVRGLSFEELARVAVRAHGEGGESVPGAVDFEGRFEVVDLAPGDWTLEASLAGGSRQARARLIIPPETAEMRRDLELGGGLELTGVVLFGGEVVPDTAIELRGHDVAGKRVVRSDVAGRFRIADLDPGRYRLSAANHSRRLVHNRDLELGGDRDVEIEFVTAAIAGVVVDGEGGEPLERALVSLREVLPDGGEGSVFALVSESDGSFHYDRLIAGRYRLSVQRDGYRPHQQALELLAGAPFDLRVPLARAEGFELVARLASGRLPLHVTVLGRAADGRAYAETRATDAAGYAPFSTLPAGRWDLLIAATGGAAVEARVAVPGEPLALVLPDAGRLRVRVPTLIESETIATLSIIAADGRPFRHLAFGGRLETAWPVVAGRAVVEGVPAGVWTVEVVAPDGQRYATTAVTTGGPDVEISVQ